MSFDVWTVGPNQVSVTADAVLTADDARRLADMLRAAADTADESELACYCERQDCPRCGLA